MEPVRTTTFINMQKLKSREMREVLFHFLNDAKESDEKGEQLKAPIVIAGPDSAGKSTLILEAAKRIGDSSDETISKEQKPQRDTCLYDKFHHFIYVRLEYISPEYCREFVKPMISKLIMEEAAPMNSARKDQKTMIIEIDCNYDQAHDAEQVLKPFQLYYKPLSKSDFVEWAKTVNPDTQECNIDPMVMGIVLKNSHFDEE